MIYKVVNHDLVAQDLMDAASYYTEISLELADRFLDEIEISRLFLSQNPYANDIMYEDIRQHLLKKISLPPSLFH